MGSDLDFNLGRIHAGHDGHQIGNRRRNLIESARLVTPPDSSSGTVITHQSPSRSQIAV
jgi:hypothetical protein